MNRLFILILSAWAISIKISSINDLNKQRMDYLVLERPESPDDYDSTRFTPQIVAAIDSNYRIVYSFFNFSWGNLFCVYESNRLYQEQYKTN